MRLRIILALVLLYPLVSVAEKCPAVTCNASTSTLEVLAGGWTFLSTNKCNTSYDYSFSSVTLNNNTAYCNYNNATQISRAFHNIAPDQSCSGQWVGQACGYGDCCWTTN